MKTLSIIAAMLSCANKPGVPSVPGYHNREGKHDMAEFDCQQFIRFINYHFRK